MTSENYNFINPVESLQNIQSLTPIQKNEERKGRQNAQQQQDRNAQDNLDESPQEVSETPPGELDDDRHSIDYRA